MRLDLDLVAFIGGPRDRRTRGLRALTLESGLKVHLPQSHDLARVVRLDTGREFFRDGSSAVSRPVGSDAVGDALDAFDADAFADQLAEELAALPNRDGAGPVWYSLRDLARYEPTRLRAELAAALASLRRALPKVPQPPKDETPRPPALTPAERKSAQRERDRHDEQTSAVWALSMWLEDEDDAPEPGSRVLASAAYDYAADLLNDAVETYEAVTATGEAWDDYLEAEEIGRPPRPRRVSRQRLYRAATEDLGLRMTRPRNVKHLVVPTDLEGTVAKADALYEALIDRMAATLLDEHREGFDAYLERLAHSRPAAAPAPALCELDAWPMAKA